VTVAAPLADWVLGSSGTDWLDAAVSAAFDPSWNLSHRTAIWAVIVTALFLSGVGFPLPEDIPLTLAGFTTFKQANDQFVLLSFVAAFAAATVPILLGDTLAYTLGKRYGFGLRGRFRFVERLLSEARMARAQRWFDHWGAFTIFLARQVAGVRFVTFFMAGTMRMPLRKFIFFDFLGCLVSVPIWLGLGALASRYGEEWMHSAVSKVGGGFIVFVALAVTILVIVARRRRAPVHAGPAPTVSVAAPAAKEE
jgi:membrane protein DedA with SNARE-associated domain